ncbi:MAG: hypothetical protein R6W87_11130 [Halospina sp.]
MRNAIICLIASLMLAGCTASPLTTAQQQELNEWQRDGVYVEEKNPALATGLGLLPGFGSFYTGHYGKGVFNFITWPASILWDPYSGYNGAQTQNYFATRAYVDDQRNDALSDLEDQLQADEISQSEYISEKRKIREKY